MRNFELAYCEIYKPRAHGILIGRNDTKYIYSSIMYQLELTTDEFFDTSENSAKKEWESSGPWREYTDTSNEMSPETSISYNPFVRNTEAIKLNDLQIVKRIYHDDYIFCIVKTFWLKIFQRKYKNYYKEKTRIPSLKSLLNRQLTGK